LEPEFGVVNFVMLTEIISVREAYPIVLAFSKKGLVTVATKETQQIIDSAKSRMNKTKTDAPSLVAYYIMDEIVSHHFSHLEKIETVTGNLEEEVLKKADSKTIHRIFGLKSRLLSFNKILWYERGLIFNLKRCEVDYVPEKVKSLIDVTHEYLTRQIDIVETYREIMSDSIDAYLSTVSNRINTSIKNFTVVMLYLTIVTTLTSFPNTVATFFGISQFGGTDYKIIFALLTASIVLPLVWLWRRKWLKAE
jgi:magnesium transporter